MRRLKISPSLGRLNNPTWLRLQYLPWLGLWTCHKMNQNYPQLPISSYQKCEGSLRVMPLHLWHKHFSFFSLKHNLLFAPNWELLGMPLRANKVIVLRHRVKAMLIVIPTDIISLYCNYYATTIASSFSKMQFFILSQPSLLTLRWIVWLQQHFIFC